MATIQTDLRPQILTDSIQANLHAFLRGMSQINPAGVQPEPRIVAWNTGIQHPWFNGVLAERLSKPEDEHLIQEQTAYFRSKGVHVWSWWVGKPARAADWASLLQKAGFRYERETPGMAMPLDQLPGDSQEVPGLEIRIVEDLPLLQVWSRVFAAGYGLPPEWAEPFYEIMAGIGLGLPFRNYLGHLNGEPVATSTLFLAEGVAGIYNVATLPQARRKGIGAALTVVPLLEARQLGYQAGILQSSQAGFSVYQKLGFEKLCEIELFVWDG